MFDGRYTSDDSALSSTKDSTNTKDSGNEVKKSVIPIEMKDVRSKSRNIMKRASFWQNRCEKGLLSDDLVREEYPQVDYVNYD
jgi:hypothetical protein